MMVRIDYYTGTGGSRRVADRIAELLRKSGSTVEVNRIVRDHFVPEKEEAFDYFLLVFAVHSFNAPTPVFEWVEKLDGRGRECGVVSVSGGGEIISNTACRRKIISALERRGFGVLYEDMVQMPNNWMSVPNHQRCARILQKMPLTIAQIAENIEKRRERRKRPYPIDVLISALGDFEKKWTAKFGQGIRVSDQCTGCGLCVKHCCSSNIRIENGKALFADRCDMCLGCIYGCPQKALTATHSSFQVDKRGYDLAKMEKELL